MNYKVIAKDGQEFIFADYEIVKHFWYKNRGTLDRVELMCGNP